MFSPRLIVHSLWAFVKGLGTHSLITQHLPLASIEKGARVHVGEAKRMRREEKNYSMIYTSKPLEEHGHHVEYCGGIYWCGEEQECYHNKRSCFCQLLSSFDKFRPNELSTCWAN